MNLHWILQRSTAILLIPTVLLGNGTSISFFFLILFLFWHMHVGLEEILTDYVHNKVIRNFTLSSIRVFLLLVMKYAFFFFVLPI